jgi:hypothetical protein
MCGEGTGLLQLLKEGSSPVTEVATEKCNRVNRKRDVIDTLIRTFLVGRAGLEPATPCVSWVLSPFR